jgi:hypothetical protein
MLDFGPPPVQEDMDVNVIYLSSVDYSLLGDDEISEMSCGPCDAIFQRPKDSENHLKLLYIWGHLDGTPISRMLIDGGAIINLLTYSFKKMGKSNEELIKKDLDTDYKASLINLLMGCVDCFAWNYQGTIGLSRDLVEHQLPIKAGFRPYKQHARCYKS